MSGFCRSTSNHGGAVVTLALGRHPTARMVNGLRLGLANGWLFLVAAELIDSWRGGVLLIDSQKSGRTDIMLLAIVLLALLGKIGDAVFAVVERRLVAGCF